MTTRDQKSQERPEIFRIACAHAAPVRVTGKVAHWILDGEEGCCDTQDIQCPGCLAAALQQGELYSLVINREEINLHHWRRDCPFPVVIFDGDDAYYLLTGLARDPVRRIDDYDASNKLAWEIES